MTATLAIEITAATLCCLYVILAAERKRLAWYPYIISSALYLWIFWQAQLPANAGLQLFFIVMGLLALRSWSPNPTEVLLQPLEPPAAGLLIVVGILTTVCITLLTGSTARALGDSAVTAGSLIATYLTERRYRASWKLWIVVNAFATLLFLSQELILTAFVYALLALLAVRAERRWRLV